MKRETWFTPVTAGLLGALLAAGGLACPVTGFGVTGVDFVALFACCLVVAAIFALCIHLRLGLVPLCVGALLLGFLWNRVGLGNSMQALLFRVTDMLDRGYGWGVLHASEEAPVAPGLAVCVLGCIHAAALTALIYWGRMGWLTILLGVAPLGLCLILTDTVPAAWAFALVCTCVLLLLFTQRVRSRNPVQGNRLTAMLALPLAVAMLALLLAFPQDTYRGQELAQKLEDWVLSLFEEPEDETPQPDPLVYPIVGGDDPILNYVNLSAVGPKEESWSLVMKVRSPDTGYIYLRGSTYNYYTGTTWMHNGAGVQWPNEQFDRTGTLKALEITTQQVHGILYSTYSPTLDPEPVAGRIVNSKQERSYLVKYLQMPAYNENWAQRVDNTMNAYSDPSSSIACLNLPPAAANWASDVLHDFEWYAGGRNYNAQGAWALAHEIAEYVANSTPYSLDTPAMPRDEADFASWFMRESPTGYCVHYATATAVLLRQAGIPARYVTGYLVPAKAGQAVTVREKDAHAWVEFFVPGVGWMPLESTPGYYEKVNRIPGDEPDETKPATEPETTEPTTRPTTPPETTRPTQPSQTTQPTQTPEEPKREPNVPVLVALLMLVLLALVAVLWRLRVWLWQRRKQQGSANARALLRWQEVQRLCRLTKTQPPEDIHRLALDARFGPSQLTSQQLRQMDLFLAEQKKQLRKKPWYMQVYYTVILAIY